MAEAVFINYIDEPEGLAILTLKYIQILQKFCVILAMAI
jgi:hypothetical protein